MLAKAGIHTSPVGQHRMRKLLLALAFVVLPIATKAATIPFVGCPTDVPGGGQVTPTGQPMTVDMPTKVAAKVALYSGAYEAVIAPRGWECSGEVGSDAISLSVTPPKKSLYADRVSITISTDMAGTGSAISDVATIGSTYFSNLVSAEQFKSFLTDWEQNFGRFNLSPPVQAPRYPADRLTYLSPSAFAYETPAGKIGIAQLVAGGSSPFAQQGIISLQGKYIPNAEDDRVIISINVSLPPTLANLAPFILAAARPCMLDENAAACTIMNNITYPSQ